MFSPAATITQVIPSAGRMAGGYLVTILGSGLTDSNTLVGHPPGLLTVSLANVYGDIKTANSSYMTILAGATGGPTRTGDVHVTSWQFGETVLQNAFTYYTSMSSESYPFHFLMCHSYRREYQFDRSRPGVAGRRDCCHHHG